jgi:hypothetical protein
MNKMQEYDKFMLKYYIVIFLLVVSFSYFKYKFKVYQTPCSIVYNDGKIIYKGNSYFYKTESRGNSTIFKEYEKKILFPKMKKEIMSDKLEIKTCEE